MASGEGSPKGCIYRAEPLRQGRFVSERLTPQYWRNRADEARATADQFRDPEQRRIMCGIADSYEQMAIAAERLSRSATVLSGFKPRSVD
jgi:hypothetical protein